MKLSKSQVIALFIGAATPQAVVTMTEMINATSVMDTVAAGTEAYQLTKASTMISCTADITCPATLAGDAKCGTALIEGTTLAASSSYCVDATVCGDLGKINGSAFQIICHNDNPPDPVPNPADLLENVEILITTQGMGAWANVRNLKVPARDNYQTGWWIRQDDNAAVGIYAETDKPVNNLCTTNNDCDADLCCANWPDNNNKRCIDVAQAGTVTTIKPFTAFTPTCAVDNDAPISAQTDLAAEAQAKAAQALTDFKALMKQAMLDKLPDGADQTETLAAWEAKKAKMDEFNIADKLGAGFDSLSDDGKALYDAEHLKWTKAVYEACEENEDSIECKNANELRTKDEAAKKTAGYYAKTAADRETFDAAQLLEKKKWKAEMTAAWVADKTNFTEIACKADGTCADATHCCGSALPETNAAGDVTTNKIADICNSPTTVESGKSNMEFLGQWYTHTCKEAAQYLVASAATLISAVYLM